MDTPLIIRNVLLRAFVVNLALIIVVWLLWLSGLFTNLMQTFLGFDAGQSQTYMAWLVGFWKILNVVLFLVPAIAIHWEYRSKPRRP